MCSGGMAGGAGSVSFVRSTSVRVAEAEAEAPLAEEEAEAAEAAEEEAAAAVAEEAEDEEPAEEEVGAVRRAVVPAEAGAGSSSSELRWITSVVAGAIVAPSGAIVAV